MILKSLRMRNYRSFYGDHVLNPVPTGCTVVIGENTDEGFSNNAAGKTTLLSAIGWALYGTTAPGAQKDRLISIGQPEVSVELTLGDVLIRRSKKRTRIEELEIYSPTSGWIKGDLMPTQSKLDRLLGLSSRTFFNSFWIDRESKAVQFVFAPPAARMKILEEIVSGDFFRALKKYTSTRRSKEDSVYANMQKELATLQARMDGIDQRLNDLRMSANEETERLQQGDAMSTERLRTLRAEQSDHESQIYTLTGRYVQRTKDFPAAERTRSLIQDVGIVRAEIAQKTAQLNALGQIKAVCPTCQRAFTGEEATKARVLRMEVQCVLQDLQKTMHSLEERYAASEARERGLTALDADISRRREAVERLKEEIEAELGRQKTLQDTKTLDRLTNQILRLEGERSTIEGEIFSLGMDISDQEEYIPRLQFWEQGFSPSGIPNLLLDNLRGLMQHYARQYIGKVSGDYMTVEFPYSESGFEISITSKAGVNSVEMFSRGEMWRGNLSTLLGLRQALLHMKRTPMNFLICDDLFSDVDEAAEELILAEFVVMAKDIPHIFLTVPRPVSDYSHMNRITVVKRGGRSEIEEIVLR